MHIRTATLDDIDGLVKLYKAVAKVPGGIARSEEEITSDYIREFVIRSLENGLILVAVEDPSEDLIGEIHAYSPGITTFKHVLSHLTLVVHPEHQQKKIGRTIFTIFLEEIGINRPTVGRVELIVRESNQRAIQLYESMGFLIEGRLEMRVRADDGYYEADIPMAWQNPNFEFES